MSAITRLGAAVIAVALAVPLSLVAWASIPAAVADVDDFEFDSFASSIELDLDAQGRSTATVTETIVADFPEFDQNRGIVRAIPLRDQGYDLGVEVVSVTDGDGEPVAWERDDEDGFALLSLGTDDFVQGRTTYVIQYELRDVIRHFADSGGDEFTWDINGDGWAQPFRTVTADVTVSPALAEALAGEYVCYAGLEEIVEPCAIARDDATFMASAGPLEPFRTLTVSIGFEGGTALQPARAQDSWVVTVVPWVIVGLAAALLVAAIAARAARWRDPARRRAIIAEFAPPEPRDLIVDGEVLRRSGPVFAALMVDLAIRGVVRIVDVDPDAREAERYGIELVDPALASEAETELLTDLFGSRLEPGELVRPSEIAPTVGAAVHARLAAAPAKAITSGLRERPRARWATAVRIASLVAAAATAWPFVWMIGFDTESVWVVLLGIVTIAITVMIWAITSPPALLTATGADRRDHLLGMREYLTVAEQERFRMLQSPEGATRVARVLWGVEEDWSRALVAGAAAAGVASSAVVMGLTNPGVLAWASSSSSRMTPLAASGGSSWSGSGGSSFSSSSFGGGFAGGGGGGGGGGGR